MKLPEEVDLLPRTQVETTRLGANLRYQDPKDPGASPRQIGFITADQFRAMPRESRASHEADLKSGFSRNFLGAS